MEMRRRREAALKRQREAKLQAERKRREEIMKKQMQEQLKRAWQFVHKQQQFQNGDSPIKSVQFGASSLTESRLSHRNWLPFRHV